MRVGKTKIAIDAIKKSKFKRILWVTTSTKLRDVDIPEEFIKWRAKTWLKKTTICCWQSLHKMSKDYDLVILDEIQKITPLSSTFFHRNRVPIVALTGTLSKDEVKKDILSELQLKVLYDYNLISATNDNIIADYKLNIVEFNLDDTKKNIHVTFKDKTRDPYYTTEFRRYQYYNRIIQKIMFSGKKVPFYLMLARMRLLHSSWQKEKFVKEFLAENPDKRYLIFCSTQKQAEEICSNVFHSKSGDAAYKAFQNKQINHLAVVNIVDTGYTFYDMDGGIVIGSNSNKNGNISQKLARMLVPRSDGQPTNLYLLCMLNTQEEKKWVKNSIVDFDPSKINYIYYKNK